VSASRNKGIRNATAPWITFLDSDDYWLKDKLSVQHTFISQNPGIVACQTDEIWIRNGRRVNPKNRHKKPSGDIFSRALRLCLVSPSSVAVKRSVFHEIGCFDESLPVAEDYDLWLRLSCRYPVHLIDKNLIVKNGGHNDQLSRKYHGMDKYRIKSITRLIKSGVLKSDQTRSAIKVLSIKCNIYGKGCIKRGKKEEGAFYLSLPTRLARLLEDNAQMLPQISAVKSGV
jgi:glycosyltransferase involved in cell wall biosynthesis